MKNAKQFFKSIIDSITEHIVVIDKNGEIQFVNKSWTNFGRNNACSITDDWHGINYIHECKNAAGNGDEFGAKAEAGIRRVVNKEQSSFYLEYPCDSPDEKRWFMMRITPFDIDGTDYFVISHQNITERKLAEDKVNELARIDGLTGIYNRRVFDEFVDTEIKRCARLKKPISLALVDIDHFKLLNDTYGHLTGDKCLSDVATVLQRFANRPSDICARYGGEEFSLVWGATSVESAKILADVLLLRISELKIPNEKSPTKKHLTASIGLTGLLPTKNTTREALVSRADELLYSAKRNGRNRIAY